MTVGDVRRRNISSVLREASRLFSETGVEHTSVGEIAKSAGVTRRSVLNYFDSKNALIKAVQGEYLRSSTAALDEYFRSPEFAALSGLEQYLGILRFVLFSLKDQYKVANNLTEMATILRHDPELEAREDIDQTLGLVSSRLKPAYEKGLADGSIACGSAVSIDGMDLVTLLLRGLYRQLAFVLESGGEENLAFCQQKAEDFLELSRKVLTCSASCGN